MLQETEPDGVWGDLEKPFEGFKIASIKVKNLPKIVEEETKDPEPEQSKKWMVSGTNEDVEMAQPTAEAAVVSVDDKKLAELIHILVFIEHYSDARDFFDINGARTIYTQFKNPESRERILHTIVHHFISLHIPNPEKAVISQ